MLKVRSGHHGQTKGGMATDALGSGFTDRSQNTLYAGAFLSLSRNSKKILVCRFCECKPFLWQLLMHRFTHRIMAAMLGSQFASNGGYGFQILRSQRSVNAMNRSHKVVHFGHQMCMLKRADLNGFSLGDSVITQCGLSLYGRHKAHETDHQNCVTVGQFLHSAVPSRK